MDFHFPAPVAVGLRECGNRAAIPKGDGQRRETWFWFSSLSIARHFRSLVVSCDFLLQEAGKEFAFRFLHFDGGSGIGLEFSLPFEFFQREIVPQVAGHAG